MRMVIFFGLMGIADSIGAQSGWTPGDNIIYFGIIIFIMAMIFDIIEFICKISK